MSIKFQLLVAVGLSQSIFLAVAAVPSAPVQGDNAAGYNLLGDAKYPMSLKFIGAADGKSYFAEINQTRNWTGAVAYCEELNLKLASIETPEQADMLNQVITEFGYSSSLYWTSGRETRKDSMFAWNGTEAQVSSSVVNEWIIDLRDNSFCVSYYAHTIGSYFRAVPCTGGYRPLCHT